MLFNLRIVHSLPSYMNSTKFKLVDHFIFFAGEGGVAEDFVRLGGFLRWSEVGDQSSLTEWRN